MSQGVIVKVAGPLVVAEGLGNAKMFDLVKVGAQGLMGEIIEMRGDRASIQVYEETEGLGPGDPVEATGAPLSVELGPGLLESVYDGVQVMAPDAKGNIVRNNIGGILLTDENGPTYGNTITGNMVLNNTKDCGITLASHYFSLTAVATPSVGGVYRNTVTNNTSNGNGAAGIGVFAGPPGAAAWSNVVSGNTAMNNGEGGIMIHSHTPLQNVNNNVVTNNTLSGNGIDPDNPNDDAPTGISIFSAVIPIPFTVVSLNQISNEHYGINSTNAVTLSGLNTNVFAASVAVPTSIH